MADTFKRELTLKFGSKDISLFEKKSGKTLTDLISALSTGSVTVIAQAISVGNHNCSFDDAYTRIDNFLSDGRTLVDIQLQVIYEIDLDWGILRATGKTIDDIRKELDSNLKGEDNSPDTEDDNTVDDDVPIEPSETKVDINGTVN